MSDKWNLKALISCVDNLSPALKKIGGVAQNTRKYLADIGSAGAAFGAQIGLPIAALTGMITGFSLVAVKGAVHGLVEMEEEFSKVSAATGMTYAQIKEMKYIAQLSDVAFEDLASSTGKLNKVLYDTASGKNKDVAALMHKLKIGVRGANGEVRDAMEVMPELADAFQRNDNQATRAAMGMAFFGKSWQTLMPMLSKGSGEITRLRARYERLGLAIKGADKEAQFKKQMQAVADLGDAIDDFSFVSKGFASTVGMELVPVLQPLLNDLTEWIADNKKLIATDVKEWLQDFIKGMRAIDWQGVNDGVKSIIGMLGEFSDHVGGAKNAVIVFMVLMNGPLIGSMLNLVAALGRGGLAFLGFALNAMAPVAPLQATSAAMAAANAQGAALVGTLGKLGALAGVVGAGFIGWEIGDKVISPLLDWGIEKATGGKSLSLGDWLYNKMHPEEDNQVYQPAGAARPSSLLSAGQVKASGKIEVSFKDAPQGMRVEQLGSGNASLPIDTSVGYRSFALGMP